MQIGDRVTVDGRAATITGIDLWKAYAESRGERNMPYRVLFDDGFESGCYEVTPYEYRMHPTVVAVLGAAERLAEELWSNNRVDEEQEALCKAVSAMHDAEVDHEVEV